MQKYLYILTRDYNNSKNENPYIEACHVANAEALYIYIWGVFKFLKITGKFKEKTLLLNS
jgi:succinate-acetate transporter protein